MMRLWVSCLWITVLLVDNILTKDPGEDEVYTVDQCYGKTMSLECGPQYTVRVIVARYGQSERCSDGHYSNFCSKEEPGNPACVGNSTCTFTTPWVYLSPECGYSNSFEITYQCIPRGLQWDICQVDSLSGLQGFLSSPSYPAKYKPALDCNLKIIAPDGYKLNVFLLDLYLAYYKFNIVKRCIDRVWVSDGVDKTNYMCTGQQRGLVFTSHANEAVVHFLSDDHSFRNAKGFWIYYEAFKPDKNPKSSSNESSDAQTSPTVVDMERISVSPLQSITTIKTSTASASKTSTTRVPSSSTVPPTTISSSAHYQYTTRPSRTKSSTTSADTTVASEDGNQHQITRSFVPKAGFYFSPGDKYISISTILKEKGENSLNTVRDWKTNVTPHKRKPTFGPSKERSHATVSPIAFSKTRPMLPTYLPLSQPTPWYLKYRRRTVKPIMYSNTFPTGKQNSTTSSPPMSNLTVTTTAMNNLTTTDALESNNTGNVTGGETTTTETIPSKPVPHGLLHQVSKTKWSASVEKDGTFISEEVKVINQANLPKDIKELFRIRNPTPNPRPTTVTLMGPLMKHIAHMDHLRDDHTVTYVHRIPTFPPTTRRRPVVHNVQAYRPNPGDYWYPGQAYNGSEPAYIKEPSVMAVSHGAPRSLSGQPPIKAGILSLWEIGAIAGGAAGMVLMVIGISITMVFVRRKRIRRLYKHGQASIRRPYKEVILAYGSTPPSSPGLHNLAFDNESPTTSIEDMSNTTGDNLVPYKGPGIGSIRSWRALRPIDEAIEDLYTEVKQCGGRIPVLSRKGGPWMKGKSKSLDDLLLKSRLHNLERRRQEIPSIAMSLSLESFGSSHYDDGRDREHEGEDAETDYERAYYHSLGSLYSDIALARARAHLKHYDSSPSVPDRGEPLSIPVTPMSSCSPFLKVGGSRHSRNSSHASGDITSYEATLLDRDEDVAL